MTRFTVKIEDEALLRDLQRLGADVGQVLKKALLAGAEIVEKDAGRRAPGPYIDHGEVKTSGHSAEVDVGPDDDHWYYRYFETGAKPHRISGSPLRFIIAGDPVFARHVRHPGMAARPFLRPALDESQGQTTDAIGDELKRVIK